MFVFEAENLPEDVNTDQDYAEIIQDNETLKLRNRKLTGEIEKLGTANKKLVKTLRFSLQGVVKTSFDSWVWCFSTRN